MKIAEVPLIAGHPALDFLNTIEAPGASDEVDHVPSYDHLLRWSERAGLLDPAQAAALADAHHPWLADGLWSETMDLRRALDAIFRAVAHGAPPPDRPLAAFNAVLGAALAHRRIGGAGAWIWDGPADELQIAPWSIALSAADLLSDPVRRAQVKVCGNPACDWLFLDATPSRRRRWCRMNVCGNAAKVRRFRERRKPS